MKWFKDMGQNCFQKQNSLRTRREHSFFSLSSSVPSIHQPNMYRLMQLSNTPLPQAAMFTHLFYAQRNRVEFISDFPHSNEAEVIHSLQVHPQGWCILSRNTSMEDSSEVGVAVGLCCWDDG